MLKRIFIHASIYGLSPYITKIASLFILPIITRDLTAHDYGVAGLVTSYMGILGVLNTLGLPVILSNSFFKHPKFYKLVWRHIYGFLTIWSVVYGVILTLLLYLLLRHDIPANELLLTIGLVAAPVVMFGPTQSIGSLYFQLNEKPIQVAWRNIFFGLLTIGLNLYTISYLKLGYLGWFWADFIAGVLMNASYWYSLNVKHALAPILKLRYRSLLRYLKVALPVVPHQYSNFLLRSSDKAVLGFLQISTSQVGRYSLASNFGNYFYTATAAIGTAVNPFIMKELKNANFTRVKYLVYLFQLIVLFTTFNFSMWSKEALWFLISNKELQTVYPLVILVVMAYNYRPMYIGSTSVIFFKEKTKQLLKITFIAGILNVGLNLVFVPVYGYSFAAYSTMLCYLYVGFSGFYIKSYKQNMTEDLYPERWMLVIVAATAIAYFSVDLVFWAKLLISLVASVGMGIVAFHSKRKLQVQYG